MRSHGWGREKTWQEPSSDQHFENLSLASVWTIDWKMVRAATRSPVNTVRTRWCLVLGVGGIEGQKQMYLRAVQEVKGIGVGVG